MDFDDIVYTADQRNRPGRNSLVDVSDKLFNSGNTGLVANTVTITLPTPPTGFLRLWQQLSMTTSALAAGDQLLFTRLTPDLLIQCALWQQLGANNSAIIWPIIGGRQINSGSMFIGMDAFLVGQESVLRCLAIFAAPVAQTANVSGWYKDVAF